jgi:hypothetical protein
VGQKIGYALYEQMRRREDGTWIDSLAEYLLPTALDTPNTTAEPIEFPEASGPFGAKGTRGHQGHSLSHRQCHRRRRRCTRHQIARGA